VTCMRAFFVLAIFQPLVNLSEKMSSHPRKRPFDSYGGCQSTAFIIISL
jgi:hypothetical protein